MVKPKPKTKPKKAKKPTTSKRKVRPPKPGYKWKKGNREQEVNEDDPYWLTVSKEDDVSMMDGEDEEVSMSSEEDPEIARLTTHASSASVNPGCTRKGQDL